MATVAIGPQKGIVIFGETLTATEGISKTAKFASAIISFLGKVLGSLAEGWHAFSGACKACVELIEVVEIFVRITEWAKCEIKGAWKIASRVCLTVFNVFNFINFLEKVKLINLNPVMEKLSSIPVLGWIINLPLGLIGLLSFSFSTVHNSLELQQNNARIDLFKNKKLALAAREQAALKKEEASAVLQEQYMQAVTAIRKNRVILGELKSFSNAGIAAQWNARKQTTYKSHINLPNRVKKVDLSLSKSYVEKSKTLLALISDIIKVVLISIHLIAPFIGGFLAGTSIPMTALNVGVAGLGFYKVFHDKFAKQTIENYQNAIKAIPLKQQIAAKRQQVEMDNKHFKQTARA